MAIKTINFARSCLLSGIYFNRPTMSLAHIREHDISKEEVRFLESEGKDYCLSHGMIYKDKNENFQHIPFTLLPSPFPEKLFTAAREVQVDFNLLVHKVSQDYHFTKTALLRYCFGRMNTISLYQICHSQVD